MNKSKIKLIVRQLNKTTKKNKKIIFFKNTEDLKKNSIVIYLRNKNQVNLMLIFFLVFFSKLKIEKNFFLLFNFKKLILGHNIFPQWPGIYMHQNFFLNLCKWIKLFLYIIMFNKKLIAIVLKIN